MDEVKNWGLMLIFVSVGCLIYYFLLPSGKISETVKSIAAVVIMSMILSPVFSVISSLRSFSVNFSEPPEIFFDYEGIRKQAESRVNEIISDTVKDFTDISYKTEISIDIKDDGSIHIKQVILRFSAFPEKMKEMKEALYERLTIMPVIRIDKSDE